MADGYISYINKSNSTAQLDTFREADSGKPDSLETSSSENLKEEPLELDEGRIHVEVDLSRLFDDFETEVESVSAPGRVATAEEIAASDSIDWNNVPSHLFQTSEVYFLTRC